MAASVNLRDQSSAGTTMHGRIVRIWDKIYCKFNKAISKVNKASGNKTDFFNNCCVSF